MTDNFAASSLSRPKESVSLIDSPNEVGRQARESVPLLIRICASFEMQIFPEITSCSGPDSYGNSATELAEGRFGTRTGNQGWQERLITSASDLTKNNKDYILRLLRFVQASVANG